jgi:hypothetical protein
VINKRLRMIGGNKGPRGIGLNMFYTKAGGLVIKRKPEETPPPLPSVVRREKASPIAPPLIPQVPKFSNFKFPYPKRGIGRVEENDIVGSSSVWDFFTYDAISDRSCCNFCSYLLAGKNCTNLRVHLKTKHPEQFGLV